MRLEHLGDALDHWKGSMLRQLTQEGLINAPRVAPMLTDHEEWKPSHFRLYKNHLGNFPILLRGRSVPTRHAAREDYFKAVQSGTPNGSDLFLDPNTGLEPASRFDNNHLAIRELRDLCIDDRVVLVYQQYSGTLREQVERLRPRLASLSSAFWTGEQVALAAESSRAARTGRIRTFWRALAGSMRDRRTVP
jgi:hypothetical protein